jgi:hypothetical protein
MSGVNLKLETIEVLQKQGKTIEDIVWAGCKQFKIPVEKFLEIANRYYDNGFGGQEVAMDLIVVGKDFWLERHDYDGSEWWEYKEMPKEPETLVDDINTVFTRRGWDCLKDVYERQNNYE